jgi:hypothetical protein
VEGNDEGELKPRKQKGVKFHGRGAPVVKGMQAPAQL